jgi:flagellar M-ring protein FliF
MNPIFEQILNIYRNMPLSRKIFIGAATAVMIAGFTALFIWANRVEYNILYANLSSEDASLIVTKLKEQRVPYQLEGGGSTIKIPKEKVYETRLDMAGQGLPKGGGAGFEIFDKTDFGATEFVQNLNHQRAIQGELARTIKEFQEVEDARVMIVMPKDSVFIEDKKNPSASIMLKLKKDLDKEKVNAVVYLVSSSIPELKPEMITVVDTTGKVLFKSDKEKNGDEAGDIVAKRQRYKTSVEEELSGRIQSMLEHILGKNKAIVRVTAEMNFTQVDEQEEVFDPEGQVARSRHNIAEAVERQGKNPGEISSVNPVVPPEEQVNQGVPYNEKSQKTDDTVNYDITKTIRKTQKPVGQISRLSVAAVLDGKYENAVDDKGIPVRKFVPRTQQEMDQFMAIVKKSMGFNEDRGDQISVESLPFSSFDEGTVPDTRFDIARLRKDYGNMLANILLVLAIFFFIVRPIVKTIKEVKTAVQETALPSPEEKTKLLAEASEDVTEHLPKPEELQPEEPEPEELEPKDRAIEMAMRDHDRTASIIRGWLNETKAS